MKTALLIVVLLLAPVSAAALEMKSAPSSSVPQGTALDDDLIASGSNVNVSGSVAGSALVAGSSVSITGPVGGLLVAAGSTVAVGGKQQMVAAAGSTVRVRALAARNAALAGSSVDVDEASRITRDLFAAGSNVSVRGSVGRNLKVAGASLAIGGSIGGDVNASGANISILPNTVIRGSLIYQSGRPATIDESAKILGRIEQIKPRPRAEGFVWLGRLLWAFLRFLMMLAFGALFIALFPAWTPGAVQRIITAPGWSVLWGLIALIVTPIAAVIAMVTIVGLPIGIAILFAYIVSLILSMVIAAIALGAVVLRGASIWLRLLVGLVIIFVLSLVPYLGFLVRLAALLFGLGAIWISIIRGRTAEPRVGGISTG